MPSGRKVIAGRVFLSAKDAESYASKTLKDFAYEIVQSGSHSLVCVKDCGDVSGTYKACIDAGVRAFVWVKP